MLAKQPRRRRPIGALVPTSKGQKLLLAESETRTAIEEGLRPTATIGVAEGVGVVVGVREGVGVVVDEREGEKETWVQTVSETVVQGALRKKFAAQVEHGLQLAELKEAEKEDPKLQAPHRVSEVRLH